MNNRGKKMKKSVVSVSFLILSLTLLFTGCSSADIKAKEAGGKLKEIVIGIIGAMIGTSGR
jgi:branched-chain amino acid transport system substrate-binding protein